MFYFILFVFFFVLVEFSVVLLNIGTGKIVDEFQSYVEPQENPNLSKFCTELTGIKQDDVNSAMPLRYVLRCFKTWVDKTVQEHGLRMVTVEDLVVPEGEASEGKKVSLNENTLQSNSKLATFVTWSDWDLNVCLYYECNRKNIKRPPYLSCWIDLKALYYLFYQRRPQGLNGALKELGMSFQGREHSGIDDARNTAFLAQQLVNSGCQMAITKFRQ